MIGKAFAFVIFVHFAAQLASSRPSIKENPQVMCQLPAVKGFCRALIPRWRYDTSTKQCHEFNFGGCDGNGNNFLTRKACMATCAGI